MQCNNSSDWFFFTSASVIKVHKWKRDSEWPGTWCRSEFSWSIWSDCYFFALMAPVDVRERREQRKPSVSSVIPVIIRALVSGWEVLRVFDLTPENLVIWGRNAQMHLKDSILIESWSRQRETNLCLSLTINSFIVSGRHLMSNTTSGS